MLCTVSLTSPPAVEEEIMVQQESGSFLGRLVQWSVSMLLMQAQSASLEVEVPVQSSSIVGLIQDPLDCTLVRCLMGVALIELCTLEWVQVQTIHPCSISLPIFKFTGVPAITYLDYDRASGTLTCISSGGPVDSVTWTKDGSLITGDSLTFSQTQTITSTIYSTYHHTLSSSNSSNFKGSFTCTIRDAVGNSNSKTRTFNGMVYYISRG